VLSRNYAQQDFANKVEEFLQERRHSIKLLEPFSDADWSRSFQHPKLGSLSALYLLENWLAHDLLHVKQILRLRYDYLSRISGNTLDYAGPWT
ncbi:MAG TPA: hypothetical protein VFX48_02650, partial [Saprospiraceae bacterium]|nr:hypothetical protein [Saprospiraceae bacterium]